MECSSQPKALSQYGFAGAVLLLVLWRLIATRLLGRRRHGVLSISGEGCCQGFLREGREGISPLSFEPGGVSADSQGRDVTMSYRWEVTSLKGFVQMLAANLLPHGYWFYVRGVVPLGKEPAAVDQKLLTKYSVELSRQQRARRKQAGQSNLHYLRWDREWILLATHGEHRFFADEAQSIRDARRDPISIGDYSLRVARGNFLQKANGDLEAIADHRHRSRVQIGREKYRELRAYFLDESCRRSVESLSPGTLLTTL